VGSVSFASVRVMVLAIYLCKMMGKLGWTSPKGKKTTCHNYHGSVRASASIVPFRRRVQQKKMGRSLFACLAEFRSPISRISRSLQPSGASG
jgi:hypothetical protein